MLKFVFFSFKSSIGSFYFSGGEKVNPHQDAPLIKPKIAILKWHLKFEIPWRNVVHCSVLEWSSGENFPFWTCLYKTHQNPPGPIKTHQNPPEPIKTHQNPPEPVKTHQNPSKPTRTHQNPSKPIKTHQNPSKPTRTHQNPSKPIKRIIGGSTFMVFVCE